MASQTFTSSSTWTCPAGVTSVTVQCWGAGGGGAVGNNGSDTSSDPNPDWRYVDFGSGPGGAGGGYAQSVISVIPGNTYTVNVGVGGGAGGGTGGDSWFSSSSTIKGAGGSGGIALYNDPVPTYFNNEYVPGYGYVTGTINVNTAAGGTGGVPGTNIGTLTYTGGTGAGSYSAPFRNPSGGGGGAGGATISSNGNNGTSATSNVGGIGGTTNGGQGGSDVSGVPTDASLGLNSSGGTEAGGGGGGGAVTGISGSNPANGGDGQVLLTWNSISTQTQTGKSDIRKTGVQKTQIGQSDIRKTGIQKTQIGQADIRRTTQRTQISQSDIRKSVQKTQNGQSNIKSPFAFKTQLGQSDIRKSVLQAQNGRSDIRATTLKTQTGVSNLIKKTTRAQTGQADIFNITTQTQIGQSDIRKTVLKTLSAQADIRNTTTQIQYSQSFILPFLTQNESKTSILTPYEIILASTESNTDDFFVGDQISLVSGSGVGQQGTITSYNGTTKIATVNFAMNPVPDSTTQYFILHNKGGIKAVSITNFGLGFTNSSSANVQITSRFGTSAVLTPSFGMVGTSPGRWIVGPEGTTPDGILDSNKVIQDSFYWQDFSYDIRSNDTIDKYRDVVKTLLHPAGMKMFGSVWDQNKPKTKFLDLGAPSHEIDINAQLYDLDIDVVAEHTIEIDIQNVVIGAKNLDLDRFKFLVFPPCENFNLTYPYPNLNYWTPTGPGNTQINTFANVVIGSIINYPGNRTKICPDAYIIVGAPNQTQLGQACIRNITIQTLSGKSSITQLSTQTQTGQASIVYRSGDGTRLGLLRLGVGRLGQGS